MPHATCHVARWGQDVRTGLMTEWRGCADGGNNRVLCPVAEMFAANKQTTTKLWMWRMEYLHHEQRPLYFGEWF